MFFILHQLYGLTWFYYLGNIIFYGLAFSPCYVLINLMNEALLFNINRMLGNESWPDEGNILGSNIQTTLVGFLLCIFVNSISDSFCMEGTNDFLLFTKHFFYFLLFTSLAINAYYVFLYVIMRCMGRNEEFLLPHENFRRFQFNQQEELENDDENGLGYEEINGLKALQCEKVGEEIEFCSICLIEFEKGENLLSLPECNHVFHDTCIELWLKEHLTCPNCRCDVRKALEKEEIFA